MRNIILPFIFLFAFASYSLSQEKFDINNDGTIELNSLTSGLKLDVNGDGILDERDNVLVKSLTHQPVTFDAGKSIFFDDLWTSSAGNFSNCWDGAIGYFDGDSLLDIAGYTFGPNKFYIYEQDSSNPKTFVQVAEFTKAEAGGYGPITFGDSDGDGDIEIIVADLSTLTRIYIYEATGNNTYIDRNTQGTLTHANNSQNGRALYITNMNKNGKKEIVCLRGTTSGGTVRVWEQSGTVGQSVYTDIYTYTTPSYIFGQGGAGDSDNDGYDEIFISYGGTPIFNTNIRRIEYDSASASFVHLLFASDAIGIPASYSVADVNKDGINELIQTCNSMGRAATYIHQYAGSGTYNTLDSIFELSDNNNMLTQDIDSLFGDTYPAILTGSFNGRTYIYRYDAGQYVKEYSNTNYPGAAIRRVYFFFNNEIAWRQGYFNTWGSGSSNGTFYLFKRTYPLGISNTGSEPEAFDLHQNYPNPFNPETKIRFGIPDGVNGNVKLVIYDALGREVAVLVNSELSPGTYEYSFDGAGLSGGVYFYKLSATGGAGDFTETKRMMLVK